MLKNDHPPTKKHRALAPAPEVHVAVNIAPIPGAGSSVMHGSYIISDSPIVQSTSVPPLGPAKVSDASMHLLSCSTPTPLPLHQPPDPPSYKSLLLLLLDCIESSRVPTILELLSFMDADDPTTNLKYADIHSELYDHGVEDVVDIYSLPVELLSTLGGMGKDRAHCLRRFTRDKFLLPLCLLENPELEVQSPANQSVQEVAVEGASVEVITVDDVSASVQVVSKDDDDSGKTIQPTQNSTRRRLGQGQGDILKWLEGVTQGESNIEEVDEVGSDTDDIESECRSMATSYKI
jgi:hypothetical protein